MFVNNLKIEKRNKYRILIDYFKYKADLSRLYRARQLNNTLLKNKSM